MCFSLPPKIELWLRLLLILWFGTDSVFFLPFDALGDWTLGQGGNLMVFLTEQNARGTWPQDGVPIPRPGSRSQVSQCCSLGRWGTYGTSQLIPQTLQLGWGLHSLAGHSVPSPATIWRSSAITSVVCEARLEFSGEKFCFSSDFSRL